MYVCMWAVAVAVAVAGAGAGAGVVRPASQPDLGIEDIYIYILCRYDDVSRTCLLTYLLTYKRERER